MTSLIVYRAPEEPDEIWLASDLLHTRGNYASPLMHPKWYRVHDWAFANAGDHRVSTTIQRAHVASSHPSLSPTPLLLPEFVASLLSDAGKNLQDKESESGWPDLTSSILWAHPRHGAWCMDRLGAVLPIPPGHYEVAGSARELLAGALAATERSMGHQPASWLTRALDVAQHHHVYSRGAYVATLREFLSSHD